MTRVGQVVHAGQWDIVKSAQLFGRLGPCVRQSIEVFVSVSEPLMPRSYFRRIRVGNISFENLQGVGETRLVDKVPAKPRHSCKALDDTAHVSLLCAHGIRIE